MAARSLFVFASAFFRVSPRPSRSRRSLLCSIQIARLPHGLSCISEWQPLSTKCACSEGRRRVLYLTLMGFSEPRTLEQVSSEAPSPRKTRPLFTMGLLWIEPSVTKSRPTCA